MINLRNTPTAPLRLRLIARPGYSYRLTENYNCLWENFTVSDIALGTVPLLSPGFLQAGGAMQMIVEGICPPPEEVTTYWGYGYGVIAVLEEQRGTSWVSQDARMILVGDWPMIAGNSGPGGGVIVVSAALQGGTQVGFLDVRVGPPSAVSLRGAWRVSPTNYGELGELRPYTNYTANALRLAIRSTNFTIQARSVAGFSSPPNQSVQVRPGLVTPLNLLYSVNPPTLRFHHLAGLGISGTAQTAYQIESSPVLRPSLTWTPYTNITLTSGINWISRATNSVSNRFFRARWLSE